MVNEYFHQVSSTFEAAQCILFPILFTPIVAKIAAIAKPRGFSAQ